MKSLDFDMIENMCRGFLLFCHEEFRLLAFKGVIESVLEYNLSY